MIRLSYSAVKARIFAAAIREEKKQRLFAPAFLRNPGTVRIVWSSELRRPVFAPADNNPCSAAR